MQFRFVSLTAFLLSTVAPTWANDGATSASKAAKDESPEIVVTGQRQQYGVKSTRSGTKTNTDIKSIPQAISVVSSKQIDDQQLRSVNDLLNFVPGASYGSGESNRDTIVLRGNSSTADFFIDGVRDDVQYFRDFYNVDRVEVLKGPNAMIFGRGGGGGVLNRVLKRPSFGAYRALNASGDSFGGVRFAGDVDQPLGDGAGVRVNAVYEDADSFRHHVDLKRYGINPTAAFQVGSETRIDLSYEFFHDRRTADRGVPSLSDLNPVTVDQPLRGYNHTFFGDPRASYSKADVSLATFAFEHRFGEGLTLRNRTLLGDYDKFYQNIYPSGAANPTTQRVALGAYNSRNDRRNLLSQTDFIWEHGFAGIEQTLLFGFELGKQKSRNFRTTGGAISGPGITGGSVSLTGPTVDAAAVFAPTRSDANNQVEAGIAAAYVQDQIRPTTWLEIVAGLRFDSFKVDFNDLRPLDRGRYSRKDSLLSPRLGVILKPNDDLSIYTSYSRSYLPQSGDQFSGLTSVTEGLKPERFDNYEAGAKWEILDGLLGTAAIYRLDRTNTRATDPLNPALTVLTGAQRSRGIELGLERSITNRWLISAGYALQKAKITQTTTAAPAGRQVPLVPRHSFSLWNRYELTKDAGIGLGLISRSKSYTSISNSVKLPGYTRVDGALYYQLPSGLEAQVNVENILGTRYFATSNGDNNIAPGAPRTVRATLGYRF
ncbi:MAG: TonB-dependent siderophore receptor [Sphingomicrobium sp.]